MVGVRETGAPDPVLSEVAPDGHGGADYPFQRPTKADVDELLTAFPSDEARVAFMAGNARTLFGISEDDIRP